MIDIYPEYTNGYTKDSSILPYPYQITLPDRTDTNERLRAVSQWSELVAKSRFASRDLISSWREEERQALIHRWAVLEGKCGKAHAALRAVLEYCENPAGPVVNAGDMTAEERIAGIADQARFGLDGQ